MRATLIRTVPVLLAVALATGGCSSRGDDSEVPGAVDGLGAAPSADGSPSSVSQPGDTGGQDGSPAGSQAASPGGHTASMSPPTTAPAAGGPAIVYFRVQQQPSCPSGTTANPIAGSPVTLEWKVTNVDRVALSVDGPGVYADNYPPIGTETLNFPCSGREGDIQRHTYTLTVTNAVGKQTRTLDVTATVHDIPAV